MLGLSMRFPARQRDRRCSVETITEEAMCATLIFGIASIVIFFVIAASKPGKSLFD